MNIDELIKSVDLGRFLWWHNSRCFFSSFHLGGKAQRIVCDVEAEFPATPHAACRKSAAAIFAEITASRILVGEKKINFCSKLHATRCAGKFFFDRITPKSKIARLLGRALGGSEAVLLFCSPSVFDFPRFPSSKAPNLHTQAQVLCGCEPPFVLS